MVASYIIHLFLRLILTYQHFLQLSFVAPVECSIIHDATAALEAPCTGKIVKPNLKMFPLDDLKTATRNFKPDTILGEGGFGRVFKGWIDPKTFKPSRVGVGIPVAVKKSSSDSLQGLEEWQVRLFPSSVCHVFFVCFCLNHLCVLSCSSLVARVTWTAKPTYHYLLKLEASQLQLIYAFGGSCVVVTFNVYMTKKKKT